jgi:hypothetical protein
MKLSIAIFALGIVLGSCTEKEAPPTTGTPGAGGSSHGSESSDAGVVVTVGGAALDNDDLAWMKKWTVGPMYIGADVNGNETLDEEDGKLAQQLLQGQADAPCVRAADIDFNGRITQNDVDFITEARGAWDLHLFVSPHMECKAYSRVASREVGTPGESVPLLLLGSLAAAPAGAAYVALENGPGKLASLDTTGKHFTITVDPSAQHGDRIEVRIYVGFDPKTRTPPEPTYDTAERVYEYAITVEVSHAP